MNVLHVNKHYVPHVGGIETVVQQLAETVGGEVLCCQERGARSVEYVGGVPVTRAASFGRLLSVPLSVDFFVLFRRMVARADVVVYHHPFPLATLAHVLFARKKKVVIWYHSDIVRQKVLGAVFRPLLRWSLQRAVAVISASRGLCRGSSVLSVVTNKTTIIPFAVSGPLLPADAVRVQAEADRIRVQYGSRPIILAVGRLVYYKGFHVLPNMLRAIPEAVCVLVGAGPLCDELLKQAREAGVQDRFFIVPPVPDLAPYFAAASVFAFPSNAPSEAFGIVQAEALAAGVPVVNMNVPSGVPDVGVDGVTGYTVGLDDAGAFTAAVAAILRDPALHARLSAGARSRARATFSRDLFDKRVRELFATIDI